ncbi:MAG TPA: glucose-1-phosphate cytidylyltransferase [Rhodopila sp.]|jgi:glucose-1-phosphate cytidylyltransferase|nr:glucose-1-phosphate cytidylyltransferase [Rhodopila sp.]
MKVVILAGGRGTRLSEETATIPKPMVEIGGRPILWHIMRLYAHFGLTDFVVCLGYKGHVVKAYFANYLLHQSDVTVDLGGNRIDFHNGAGEDWRVTLVDTGDATQTGGRIRRVASFLPPDEPFCMTYGDGLGDIDIARSIAFHRAQGRLATVTAVRPPPRFGGLRLDGDAVATFTDAPVEGWINGGFFVLQPNVLDLIAGDATVFEREPLQTLAGDRQLTAFTHHGFWQPMDTLREKIALNALWDSGAAPWKLWG